MRIWYRVFSFIMLAITMSGFTQISYAWTLSDNFDSGVIGSVVAAQSPVLNGGGSKSYYSNDVSYSGSQSVQYNISGGSTGGGWGGVSLFNSNGAQPLREGDEVWVRVRTYMPGSFDYTANPRLKFLRYHVKQQNGTHIGYADIYINNNGTYRYINELNNTSYSVGREGNAFDASYPVRKDEWETVVYYIKFSANNARIKFWKEVEGTVINGKRVGGRMKLLFDEGRDLTLVNSTDQVVRFLMFTYWNGGSPKTQHMYMDDFYVSTTDPPPELGGLAAPNPPVLN